MVSRNNNQIEQDNRLAANHIIKELAGQYRQLANADGINLTDEHSMELAEKFAKGNKPDAIKVEIRRVDAEVSEYWKQHENSGMARKPKYYGNLDLPGLRTKPTTDWNPELNGGRSPETPPAEKTPVVRVEITPEEARNRALKPIGDLEEVKAIGREVIEANKRMTEEGRRRSESSQDKPATRQNSSPPPTPSPREIKR